MSILFQDRISAVLLPAAGFAPESCPDRIELIHGRFHQGRIIREDPGLKVSGGAPFHANSGTGKVGRADVRHFTVEDNQFEMYPRTQRSLQSGKEDRIPVEILPEVGPRLFGVDEAHFPALRDQVRKDAQEGPVADIQVLDVSRSDP